MIRFVSYADERFRGAGERIARQAAAFNLFDSIHVVRDVYELNVEPWVVDFCRQQPKGGYGIWKPCLLSDEQQQARPGDVIVYADAGCHLDPQGKERMLEYFVLARAGGVLAMQTRWREREYTKPSLLVGLPEWMLLTGQICTGLIVITGSQWMVEKWKKQALQFNGANLLPDDFVNHRYDQSLWSVLCKTNQVLVIPEESEPETPVPFVRPVLFARDNL